jgi:hypothetical protein
MTINDAQGFCNALSEISKRYNVHLEQGKGGISIESGRRLYGLYHNPSATADALFTLVSAYTSGKADHEH